MSSTHFASWARSVQGHLQVPEPGQSRDVDNIRDVESALTDEERPIFQRVLDRMSEAGRQAIAAASADDMILDLRVELWRDERGQLRTLGDSDIQVGDELTPHAPLEMRTAVIGHVERPQ